MLYFGNQLFGLATAFWVLIGMAGVFSLLAILAIVIGPWLRKSKIAGSTAGGSVDKSIDLIALEEQSPDLKTPPPIGAHLQLYGEPTRLVVFVLAPRGRSVQFPPPTELHHLVDRIVPGVSRILDSHQPIFRRWEPQMSFEGFTHAFNFNMQLPGDKGKGTPWSSVAGKISVPGGQLFAGMVCRSANENQVGTIVVEHEGKWSDLLRVIG